MWPFDQEKGPEWKTISRDPFARQEIVRRVIHPPEYDKGCDWCGGFAKRSGLFEYGIERDDKPGRVAPISGKFCSISCLRSYHS